LANSILSGTRKERLAQAQAFFWRVLAALSLYALSSGAQAGPAADAQAQPISEVWLNPGFYAYHFQKDRNLNNDAFGFGAEYRYSSEGAFEAGVFYNSYWHTSHYLAYCWRPVMAGPVRLGVIAGAVDGYPGTRNGGWFPLAIPTAQVEFGRVGVNILFIPSIGNSVNGSITFQLNVKVY
jgi:hypothetical protein